MEDINYYKILSRFSLILLFLYHPLASSQQVAVSIGMTPVGSFKIKVAEVVGSAKKLNDSYEAANVSVNLTHLETGVALRDKHTKNYLQTDKFPSAILVSAKGHEGKGTGVIRIMGIEKPIAGTYEVEGKQLRAHFPIKLSDFKIEGIKYRGIGVNDSAEVEIALPIEEK